MLVEAQQQGRLTRKLAQLARFDIVTSTSWATSRSTVVHHATELQTTGG